MCKYIGQNPPFLHKPYKFILSLFSILSIVINLIFDFVNMLLLYLHGKLVYQQKGKQISWWWFRYFSTHK